MNKAIKVGVAGTMVITVALVLVGVLVSYNDSGGLPVYSSSKIDSRSVNRLVESLERDGGAHFLMKGNSGRNLIVRAAKNDEGQWVVTYQWMVKAQVVTPEYEMLRYPAAGPMDPRHNDRFALVVLEASAEYVRNEQ